ncbi:hypothetical protein [Phenylobacterium aquaticum]|uniref:hypothetical protein n=2 Tax=Phenylobacterium aquaticum TaxID=1763816 RepID=UPI0026F323D8|nr:hypothetical protein [Phenylobacterium aquaticum]
MSQYDPRATTGRGVLGLSGPRLAWAIGGAVAVLGALGVAVLAGRHAAAPTEVSGPRLRGGQSVDIEKLQAATASLDAAAKAMKTRRGAVKTLSAEALQAYLPGAVDGLTRRKVSVEAAEENDLSGPTVRGHYAGKGASLDLSVSDLGAAGALAALAGAFNVESTRQTDGRIEKVGKVDGRMTAETWDPASRKGEYSVLVADRFMIHVEGQDVDLATLRNAAIAVGFAKLQAAAR